MSKLILPYHVLPNTLAHLKGQPLFLAKSMRDVDLSDAVKACQAYLPSCSLVHPESEALTFYAGNAAWAEMCRQYGPDEPLPPDVLSLGKLYLGAASDVARRLFYYLLLIISRESRHVHANSSFKASAAAKWGSDYVDFNAVMHSSGSSMAAKSMFLNNAPTMKLGKYAAAIEWTFRHGSFSGGYGGIPWADIAKVFLELVEGNITPEVATDVSWALCHNNGPIFNKGMTYHGYDSHQIKTILDVQRSGQIPELIKDCHPVKDHYVTPQAKAIVNIADSLFPKAFGPTVDWVKVEKAGAVQSYSTLKTAQMLKSKTAGKKVFYVMPDTWVEVIERKAA